MSEERRELFLVIGQSMSNMTFGSYEELRRWLVEIDCQLTRSDMLLVWNYAMSQGRIKRTKKGASYAS